jgi:hypothetical protein
MSYEAEAGRSSAALGGLMRLLVIVGAPTAGFLAASGFEHCGGRLLSMAIGVGIGIPAAGSIAARIMRFDVFGAIVFVILATLFVLVAGPKMEQCRPGL